MAFEPLAAFHPARFDRHRYGCGCSLHTWEPSMSDDNVISMGLGRGVVRSAGQVLSVQFDDWQRWDTAPKDGSFILAFFPAAMVAGRKGRMRQTEQRIMIIRWWSAGEIASDWGSERRLPIEQRQGGFWGGRGNRSQPTMGVPSHWMPLPAPPATP